jgi:hypothetical protein
MPKVPKGMSQDYQLQDFTFNAAMALKQALAKEDGTIVITREDASAIYQLVKAWESRSGVKPLPGSRRPALDKGTTKIEKAMNK